MTRGISSLFSRISWTNSEHVFSILYTTLLFHKRTLAELQALVLAGKYGNALGILKPLDGLLVNDLRAELQARGMPIAGKLKDELQNDLVETLRGARVPTVLV